MIKPAAEVFAARSYFARKLAADPELATRCEKVTAALRKAAQEEISACEQADQLTAEDLSVTINARAEQ